MSPNTKIYISVSASVEIEINLIAREYNGIDNDPQMIERDITVKEMAGVIEAFRPPGFLTDVAMRPGMDYPVAGSNAERIHGDADA